MSLSDCELLYTPAFAVECVDSCIVVSDVPVCADNAVIAVLLASEVSDDVLAEAVTNVLS